MCNNSSHADGHGRLHTFQSGFTAISWGDLPKKAHYPGKLSAFSARIRTSFLFLRQIACYVGKFSDFSARSRKTLRSHDCYASKQGCTHLTALLTRLVLPLLAVFGIALAVHFICEADGFFLNLATELVGILITICYVDWILRRHEQQRWIPTDERIANRLRVLLNGTISGLRDGLGFGADVLDQCVAATLDPYAMHKEVIRVGEHVIAPAALSRVQALDQDGWSKLARHIQNAHNGIVAFLNTFQTRLSPDQMSDILDLQESLAKSLTHYSTFPDIMGVPEDQLPETNTPPEFLQQFGCESTAKELQNICAIARTLSESVDAE